MSEREEILGRIREALRVSAPRPHGDDKVGGKSGAHLQAPDGGARQWLPAVGASQADWAATFARNASDLKAAFVQLKTRDELRSALAALRDSEKWHKVASHSGELSDLCCGYLELPVLTTDSGYKAEELEKCEVAITQCDALVAQTGSVLLTARSAGGRALSVLPPHHVVIATRDQLVPDLVEAFALVKRKYGQNYPSFISLVSGPSRTGDIERILVLGAHGPRKLTIFCLEGA